MDRSEISGRGKERSEFKDPQGEEHRDWIGGENKTDTLRGSGDGHSIISRIKTEISEDIGREDIELPKTPIEMDEEEFKPDIPTIVSEEPSKILNWVSEISQWDALYGLGYTMASTTGATIFGLVIGKSFEIANHWSLILLFVLGLFSAIATKVLKQREQKQKIFIDERLKELEFKEEVHKQTLQFNEDTLSNKLAIEMKREELRGELERNDAIDVFQMYNTLLDERPTSGDKLEYDMYMKALDFATEVVKTHALDRALRYNKYDVFQYNKVIDNLTEMSENIRKLVDKIETSGNGNYEDRFYSTKSIVEKYKVLVKCEEILKKATENNFGIIKTDDKFIVLDINDEQAKYTGTGIYNYVGKSVIKIVEENYSSTIQINAMLKAMNIAKDGIPNCVIFKNFRTLDKSVVSGQLCIVPDFDENTLEIEGMYFIKCDDGIDFDIEKETVELTIEDNGNPRDKVVLLIGTTITEDVQKYQDLFSRFGYNMVIAQSITEAITIMEKQLIHLALIGTIFKDGMADEMVKEMIKRYPNVQIVVVATHENPALEAKLKDIPNVSDYLLKPVAPQIILTAVQNAEMKALSSRILKEQVKRDVIKNGGKKNVSKVDMTRPR